MNPLNDLPQIFREYHWNVLSIVLRLLVKWVHFNRKNS